MENDKKVPFLEVLVRRIPNETLETSVYCKATHTDQLLSFHINKPKVHKISCFRTLMKRTKHCSTMKLQNVGESQLFRMFQKKDYSGNLIRITLNRTKKEINGQPKCHEKIAPSQKSKMETVLITRDHRGPQTHQNYEKTHFEP